VLEILNNLQLAQYLETLPTEQQSAEYSKLLPELKFKVKSFGFLMTRYEQWKNDHAAKD